MMMMMMMVTVTMMMLMILVDRPRVGYGVCRLTPMYPVT
jgi:hypothetical protein